MKSIKLIIVSVFLLTVYFIVIPEISYADGEDVYVINLHGEVTSAMASYLEREIEKAQDLGYEIVLDIDTWGGVMGAADSINNILLSLDEMTTAFVSSKAVSAGVILAISCDNVAMAKDAFIGAAEPMPNTEKVLSAWKSMLAITANEKGRPVDIILSMADSRIVIEDLAADGELVTLSADQAIRYGVADKICEDIDDVIKTFNLGNDYVNAAYTTADRFAKFLTGSVTLSILFTLGILLAIMEIFTAGFGIAGIASLLCFGLYFFGGYIAGFTEWWSIALFVLGAVCIVVELTIPGFGIFGILGIIFSIMGLAFSSSSIIEFFKLSAIALAACIIAVPIMIKIFKRAKILDKLTNTEKIGSTDEENEISSDVNPLLGKVGYTITALHPSGKVMIEGKRMDVMANNEFIDKNQEVYIVENKNFNIIVEKVKHNT